MQELDILQLIKHLQADTAPVLLNPAVRDRVHRNWPLLSALSRMSQANTATRCLFAVHILPSAPRSSIWSFSFRFADLNVCTYHLSRVCYKRSPSHACFLSQITFGREYKL